MLHLFKRNHTPSKLKIAPFELNIFTAQRLEPIPNTTLYESVRTCIHLVLIKTSKLPPIIFCRRKQKTRLDQLLIGAKADLHTKDDRGRTALKFSNNRRCKERIREAERREERAAEAQRQLVLQQKRDQALRRREQELLDRVDLRAKARTGGHVLL